MVRVLDVLYIHVLHLELKNARGKIDLDVQRYTCIDLYIKLRNA
jgi:hypothetical protein